MESLQKMGKIVGATASNSNVPAQLKLITGAQPSEKTFSQISVEAAASLTVLTQRQRGVLNLLIEGRRNKEIAHALAVSQRTVENHRAAIMKRTGCASLMQLLILVIFAMKSSPAQRRC